MSEAERAELNANRVGLVTGPSGLTYIRLGDDLAKLLDDHENLAMRVIAMTSRGSLQNIDDLINLQGVDLAIVQSDVLEYLAQHGGQGFAGIQGRIGYLARLYDEELHVLARPGIDSFADLRGKRVNLGEANSGTYLTGTNLLGLRGIEVVASYVGHDRALAMLEAGTLDAMLVVAGKPAQLLASIDRERVAAAGLRFVPIEARTDIESYGPGQLTAAAYPELVDGDPVPTLAFSAVMAVYLFPEESRRYPPLARFTERLFDRFAELQDPAAGFHPKWQEVDLATEQPGWLRFAPAAALAGRLAAAIDCDALFLDQVRSTGVDLGTVGALELLRRRTAWLAADAPKDCG